jgi:hypothetical protein
LRNLDTVLNVKVNGDAKIDTEVARALKFGFKSSESDNLFRGSITRGSRGQRTAQLHIRADFSGSAHLPRVLYSDRRLRGSFVASETCLLINQNHGMRCSPARSVRQGDRSSHCAMKGSWYIANPQPSSGLLAVSHIWTSTCVTKKSVILDLRAVFPDDLTVPSLGVLASSTDSRQRLPAPSPRQQNQCESHFPRTLWPLATCCQLRGQQTSC